jgi:hypothetical protein
VAPTKGATVTGSRRSHASATWARLTPRVAATCLGPRARILELFDRQAAAADRAGHSYRGCPFIRAQLHFENDQHPASSVVAAHKAEMVSDLTDILRQVGLPNPAQIARAVLLLFDGAAIHAEIAGNGDPFRLARSLVDGHLIDIGTNELTR